MTASNPLSSQFLADLDAVLPFTAADECRPPSIRELESLSESLLIWRCKKQGQQKEFLADLEAAYTFTAIEERRLSSIPELDSLGNSLQNWRCKKQGQLRERLMNVTPDDPLLCPVSLLGTMDFGRLETAHTRAGLAPQPGGRTRIWPYLARLLAGSAHGVEGDSN